MNKKNLAKVTGTSAAAFLIAGTTAFTAFAAMPEGTVVIGNKAFSLDYANLAANVEEIRAAVIAGGDIYVKAPNGTWYANSGTVLADTTAIPAVAYKAADGTVTNYQAKDGNVVVANTAVAVESVTATNAKTLVVKFSQAVNPANSGSGALNPANYSINGTALTGADTLVKSDDNKTITITLASLLTNNTSYAVTINGIKAQDLVKDVPLYTQVLTFVDSVSPTASLSYNSAIQAKVTFSEPMTSIGTVKIYDSVGTEVVQGGTTFTVSALSATGKTFTISMGADILNGSTYTVKIVGASDLAGNLIAANPTVLTLTKSVTELVAPKVSSIVADSSNKVVITFNEKVSNPGTISCAGMAAMTINTTAVTGNATVSADGLVYTVSLDAANATAVKTAGVYNVTAAGYVDMNGNAGAASTSVVSFPGDTKGPAYVDKSVVDINGTKYLVINFDSAVTLGVIADDAATVIDADGIQSPQTVSFVGNTFLYNPTAAATTNSIMVELDAFPVNGDYTFDIPAGLIRDNVANGNEKISLTFTKNDVTGDVTAPTIDATADTAPYTDGYNIQSVNNNTIRLKFTEALDKTTALDVNNYLIDNQVVAKSVVFEGDTKTVKLTLNDSAVTLTGAHLFTVRNVKDVAGNAMKIVSTTKNFTENAAPSIIAAKLTSTSAIKLTFGEAVEATTGVNADDFEIYVDGVNVTQGAAFTALAADVSGTTITLQLATPLSTAADLAKTITVKNATANDVVDASGNALKSATITVAK